MKLIDSYLRYLNEYDNIVEQYRACRKYCDKLPAELQMDCFKKCDGDANKALSKVMPNVTVFGKDYHIGRGSTRWRPLVGAFESYDRLKQVDLSLLPEDLVDALINRVYPSYYGPGTYDISEIEKAHSRFIKLFELKSHTYFDDIDSTHELVLWLKEMLKEIKKHQLIGILTYANGDVAYYSCSDRKVHDFNRKHGYLAHHVLKEPIIWDPQPYRKWIGDVESWRHVSSYYNDNFADNRGRKDGIGYHTLYKA